MRRLFRRRAIARLFAQRQWERHYSAWVSFHKRRGYVVIPPFEFARP